jgi:hypothetical protein
LQSVLEGLSLHRAREVAERIELQLDGLQSTARVFN